VLRRGIGRLDAIDGTNFRTIYTIDGAVPHSRGELVLPVWSETWNGRGFSSMSAHENFRRNRVTLSRDITVVLAVKVGLLLMLWVLFFRATPVTTSSDVAATILNDAALVLGKDKP
jgi:hypothetical protein